MSASRLIAAQAVDAELLAAPLVLLCCGLVLTAVRQVDRTARAFVLAAAAGVAGATAGLLKQNLVDGLVSAPSLWSPTESPAVARRAGSPHDSGPVAAATAAMVAYGVVAMALGVSFWSQHLLGLIPATAIASAALAGIAGGWTRLRPAAVALVATSGTVAAVAGALVYAGTGYPFGPTEELVSWLRSSARADDDVVVTYGGPHVIAMSELDPAYPYLWSLGARTLDPNGEELERTLSGPDAPTWVVEWNDVWAFEVDDAGDLRDTLARRYDQVATVCDVEVHLREGAVRTLPWTGERCDE